MTSRRRQVARRVAASPPRRARASWSCVRVAASAGGDSAALGAARRPDFPLRGVCLLRGSVLQAAEASAAL
jgi:hypothetical protein